MAVIGMVVVLVGFVVARTVGYGSVRTAVESAPEISVSEGLRRATRRIRAHTDHFASRPRRVRCRSISSIALLSRDGVSKVHSQLRRETVATHSLLYTWSGSDSSLKPILFMGHLDVVPVEPKPKQVEARAFQWLNR